MHIKPWDPDNPDAFLGDDALDWDTILGLANTTGGVDWYIVEYERDAFPPLEALQANLKNFQEMRSV
jgi:sugar phosphate isomerase/epimerase